MISFGSVPDADGSGENEYTTVFNRDLGIVKWCRLCDRVSRSVGGLMSIMLFIIL